MADSQATEPQSSDNNQENRRSFIAIITGGLAMLAPMAAGLWTFISPLFGKAKTPQVRVALLDQVPDDGQPYFFPVVADRKDAWTSYAKQKIGSVFLVRQPGAELPTAFTAKCPHAGCAVSFSAADQQFKCPCHTSSFNVDGSRVNGDQEVAPRDMDTLEVELQEIKSGDAAGVTAVLVKFVDYKTGHSHKIEST